MNASSRLPALAIVANALTPYRLHLHKRLIREIPELQIWSLFTHDASNADWTIRASSDIRPVYFGPGEKSQSQSHLSRQPHEWRKGGHIIKWLRAHHIRAVVLLGYNDLGRLRILHFCCHHNLPCFLFGDSNILCDRHAGVKAQIKELALRRVLSACSGLMYCGSLGRAYFSKYGAPPEKMFQNPSIPEAYCLKNS